MDEATQSGAETSELSQDQAILAITDVLNSNDESSQEELDQDSTQTQDENQDDDGQSEDDNSEGQEEKTYTLKVNGKDVVKTESEVIADAQRVLSAQEKFEEAANIRRQSEQQQNVIAQERAQLQQATTAYRQQLEQMMQQNQPDWVGLLENDPQEYLRMKHVFEVKQVEMQRAQQVEQHLKSQQEQEFTARQKAYHAEEQQKLYSLMPELADPAKKGKEITEMSSYLKTMNLDPAQVLSEIADHRFMKIIRDAAKFNALASKQSVTSTRVEKLPPKVEKSGKGIAQEPPRIGMDKLNKSGRREDAQALILNLLN
jgi:hypothetical protein